MKQDEKNKITTTTTSSSITRPQPAFISSLCAGALSGLTVDLLFYPIDTLKTRLQSSQGFLKSGGFSGIYRGIGSVAVGSAPGAAIFFVTYEGLKPIFSQFASSSSSSSSSISTSKLASIHMISASIAEISACLIRVPTEVIKSRQQTSIYGIKTSSFLALKTIIKESGIKKGLYVGFSSTIGREIPFTCIQFPLYEQLKRLFSKNSNSNSNSLSIWKAGIAGSIAGSIAAGLTTPLDVVKTRIMLQRNNKNLKNSSSNNSTSLNVKIIPTLIHIYKTEGIKKLFSGFIPRTLWIGLGGFAFLGTFEAGIKLIEGDKQIIVDSIDKANIQ